MTFGSAIADGPAGDRPGRRTSCAAHALPDLPPELFATEPAVERGLEPDEVRLLVARDRAAVHHRTFRELPGTLQRGDLLVVNTSAPEPAAVEGRRDDGSRATVLVAGPAPDGLHVVELRTPDGHPVADGAPGECVRLPHGVVATLLTGHPDPHVAAGSRLWRARIPVAGGVGSWLAATGHPIRPPGCPGRWPLTSYRTLFAQPCDELGSAQPPSSGRPFTPRVLVGLHARGIGVARLVLHTGLCSPDAEEPPTPERYRVPAAAAEAVNRTRAHGGRVVAVGATVTRALETVADRAGRVRAGAGWTRIVLGPQRPARVVDGVVTGWQQPHEPQLSLLTAVVGTRLVERAYAAAVEHGYRGGEFGDSCLLLPARRDV